nr:hypothetical protein [Tanacetum cinerariifolium]
GGDEVTKSEGESDEEETRQEEEDSFDPIPRTPEGSEDEGNDEEDQDLRLSEEAMIQEEEEADELYRDVDINQGRGLQVSQDIEDSHVTLTSVSSFVTSMLNPTSDAAPIPPTPIPSDVLQNLPTFDSVFRFDKRLKSLETTFSEYRQTNPFVDAVSAIPDEQRNLYKALVDAYEADKTILESYGESAILKRRRKYDDDQERPSAGSDRESKRQREGREHASADTPSEPATRDEGRSTSGNQSRHMSANESAYAEYLSDG